MTMKSKGEIQANLDELRTLIDASGDDAVLMRIAYEMETAVRWAIEDTVDWPSLADQAKSAAEMLKQELESA